MYFSAVQYRHNGDWQSALQYYEKAGAIFGAPRAPSAVVPNRVIVVRIGFTDLARGTKSLDHSAEGAL